MPYSLTIKNLFSWLYPFFKLENSFMEFVLHATLTVPIGNKTQTFLTHFTHFRSNIVFLIGMATHALEIVVGHVLETLAFAARTQAKCSTHCFGGLMVLE